jgi:micrococcal nuclease
MIDGRRIIVSRAIKWMLLSAAISGALICCAFFGFGRAGALPASGLVRAVFDGDTVLLASGEKVRYLGIDAPEVEHGREPGDCFGNEARNANADLVLHKRVILGYDGETVDSYGRLLAFVSLPDGRCVNAELIKSGHACVFRSSEPHARSKELMNLQRDAIRNRRGLWGGCPVKPSPFYVGNQRSFVLHRGECSFGKKISRRNRIAFQTRWMGLEEGYRPARCCKP